MNFSFNREKLTQLLDDFRNATGINMNILDKDFKELYLHNLKTNPYCAYIQSNESGCTLCKNSDRELLQTCKDSKQAQIRVCHAGLTDIAVPLFYEDLIIGYLILGQIKHEPNYSNIKASELNAHYDSIQLKRHYDLLPILDSSKIDSIINLAVLLAKSIIYEDLMFPVSTDILISASAYIDANLASNPNIKEISKAIGCSTSALYKTFHKYYNCTIGEFLTKRKIEKSIYYLLHTELPIDQISQKTGFSSTPYFSKKFKEEKGVSPLKFRKQSIHL